MRIHDVENENLKRYSKLDDDYKPISVTDKVMMRIENARDTTVIPGFKKFRSVPVMLIFCLCFVSLTTYAATEIAAIYNKQGKVVVDTFTIEQNSEAIITQNSVAASSKPHAKEGQVIAYYADNSDFKTERGSDKVLFEYNPKEYYDMDQLMEDSMKYSSPSLKAPTVLPGGYEFDHGKIVPRIPLAGDGVNSEYNEILSELTLLAKSLGDNQLATKNIEWNESDGIHMYFSDLEGSITLVLIASYGEKISLSKSEASVSQKIIIGDQEALFITGDQENYNTKLAWYDESTSTAFFLADNSREFIKKEDLIKIAESVIN